MKLILTASCLLLVLSLNACTSDTAYAPLVNGWHQKNAKQSTYTVQNGDTLYSIAWAFGLDFKALASANHLNAPYSVEPGERLIMINQARSTQSPTPWSAPSTQKSTLPQSQLAKEQQSISITVSSPKQKSTQSTYYRWNTGRISHWIKPAKGEIKSQYNPKQAGGSRGIQILGKLNEPIYAAAQGQIVYCGNGIRGYGNLILIKHNDAYLSAYAYNKKILVHNGERVKQGQRIATMGMNRFDQPALHFEIRKNGRPINPVKLLI